MARTKAPPLWKHQKKTIAFGEKNPRMLDFSDPGTAKTRPQLELFAARRRKKRGAGAGGCALILCPRSLMKAAWFNDAKKFVPDMTCSIAYADVREKAFSVDADIYITNIDAVNWLVKQKPAFFKKFDTLIIDEVTKFKHHTSGRSRAANKIKKYFAYRSALTGTPNSNTIADIWHPVLLIDDGKRLGPSFFAFRSTVCVPEQVGPRAEMVRWVDKDGAEEAVFGVLADITIRHEFDKVMDVPEMREHCMEYELTSKQMKAYLEMERDQIALLVTDKPKAVAARLVGKTIPFTPVTAINAAAVRTKLLQIASGAVYESPDKYHVVDTERYELAMDLAESRKHPIVYFLWKHQRDLMCEEAKKRGMRFCVFDGNASDRQREEMEAAYQKGFYDVFFAHPESAAHGLTLTKGTSTIWPSPTDNLEWWAQGNRRQRRGGQTEKTEVLAVIAKDTIEERVYSRLQAKDVRMDVLLSLFAEAA